jgi:hypothetical protein
MAWMFMHVLSIDRCSHVQVLLVSCTLHLSTEVVVCHSGLPILLGCAHAKFTASGSLHLVELCQRRCTCCQGCCCCYAGRSVGHIASAASGLHIAREGTLRYTRENVLN